MRGRRVEVWTLLIMPLFVTLETSLLAGLENTGKNWKSLLALPAPAWTVYVSKLVVTVSLLWSAHVLLIGGLAGSGRVLKLVYPALNLGRMPLAPFVLPMCRISVSAPIHAVLGGAAGEDRLTIVAMGGAVTAASAGCWEFVRREIG